MPYVLSEKPCKKCGKNAAQFRNRWNAANQKWYVQSTCVECERAVTRKHQQDNREYWQEVNRQAYARWTPEYRQQRNSASLQRHYRTVVAARERGDELTAFVFSEAQSLCKLRKAATGIEWHRDHVIPLNGKTVSGLHVWNNIQVIPAFDNRRKGAKEL